MCANIFSNAGQPSQGAQSSTLLSGIGIYPWLRFLMKSSLSMLPPSKGFGPYRCLTSIQLIILIPLSFTVIQAAFCVGEQYGQLEKEVRKDNSGGH